MKQRDVLIIPYQENEKLVFSTDNSGGIGLKKYDEVNVPYDIVAYYGVRVAAMELLAVGAEPRALIIHSFNGDEAWESLVEGAGRVFTELKLNEIEVTGSSESNFSLLQSATSFTLTGMVRNEWLRIGITPEEAMFAVVGDPLVGEEVIHYVKKVLSFPLFKELLNHDDIYEVIPVGSKGILYELGLLTNQAETYSCELPLKKSAGPATCVVISYSPSAHDTIKKLCGPHFYPLVKH